jgi:hypothetical protein
MIFAATYAANESQHNLACVVQSGSRLWFFAGGMVGTSISLTDLLKSRYNTWVVNTKSDSSHQRKYPGLQLGIWNLDKDEVAAYLGDKLGTKTMAASEDPRFKGVQNS